MISYLYQIAHLGDDDDEPEFSSAMPLEEGDTFFFAPRPLKNLVLVDEMESLSPVMACHIADLGTGLFALVVSSNEIRYLFFIFTNIANEDTPQLYTLCGRGPRSSLRVLRHGLEVSEMAVSELPGNPNAVWTVKKRADGKISINFSSCGASVTRRRPNNWWFDRSSNTSLLSLGFPASTCCPGELLLLED